MVTNQRLHRDVRTDHPPAMKLTARDLAIIEAVASYRVLRQDQIQTLFFGSRSTAQYRLSHLYQHGFLNRWFLPVAAGRSPTLYTLDRRGADLIRGEYGGEPRLGKLWDAQAGPAFLEHTLAINDVRIAVTLACQQQGLTLATWADEAAMKATPEQVEIRLLTGKRMTISLIPDSYFALQTPRGVAHFFLELDRGTMTVKRFQTKILAYVAYVVSGAYTRRYQVRSLRVLTVTLSEKRLANLKKSAEAVHGGSLFWFSLSREITPLTVLATSIWQVAENTTLSPLIDLIH